jgi:hypothetical protein
MLAPDSAARADSPEFCLACRRCGERHDLGPLMSGCPRCAASGTLSVVEVAYRRRPEGAAARAWSARAARDAYAALVPGGDPRYRVSLGEGATPLLRADLGHGRVEPDQLQGRVGRDHRALARHLAELTRRPAGGPPAAAGSSGCRRRASRAPSVPVGRQPR